MLKEPFLPKSTACVVRTGPHHPSWEDAVLLDRAGHPLALKQLNRVAWTPLATEIRLDQPPFSDLTSIWTWFSR